ncbi:MAG: hypothetical protein MUE72_08370 [Chitinophagaceae bacterium]|jgi:hypothetical protein|nr:hypothetical protein [Chitinophagaceae bacterium]
MAIGISVIDGKQLYYDDYKDHFKNKIIFGILVCFFAVYFVLSIFVFNNKKHVIADVYKVSKIRDTIFVYYRYKVDEKQKYSVEKFSKNSLYFDTIKIKNMNWVVITSSEGIFKEHLVAN